jgi:hypothetical protein
VLKLIGTNPSNDSLNVSPINQHETYTERSCEEIESQRTTDKGMVESNGQQDNRWMTEDYFH